MGFVLDASVTASWAFPDEQNAVGERAAELLESAADFALVPSLWWYEVRNILVVSERRGRTTAVRSSIFLDQIAELRIEIDTRLEGALLLDLAREHRLSAYDAAYLALAIRERLPLATLDKDLQAAARASGVPLLGD